jgi:NDP-sugar pyrophosphorylase family protein
VVRLSVVGPGAVVEAGARVTESVVMAGARIGEGSVLERAIVGPGATVGPGSRLSDLAVVGADTDVPSGTHLAAAPLPPPEEWSAH